MPDLSPILEETLDYLQDEVEDAIGLRPGAPIKVHAGIALNDREIVVRSLLKDGLGRVHGYLINGRAGPESEDEAGWRYFNVYDVEIIGYSANKSKITGDEVLLPELRLILKQLRGSKLIFGNLEKPLLAGRTAQLKEISSEIVAGFTLWRGVIGLNVTASVVVV